MTFKQKITAIYKKLVDTDGNDLTQEEKEFLPGVLEITETPASPKAYWLFWIITILFVIVILWAIFGQVDEVAVANGKVVPAGYTKTVQAEDKGVVKNIFVKDGNVVKAGDVLIELDTTMTAADMEQYRKEKAYYNLELERLTAEQQGKPFVYTEKNTDVMPDDIIAQTKLYKSRLAEYRTKVRSSEQVIMQTEASITKEIATRDKLAQQLEIISEQEEIMKKLTTQGAVSTISIAKIRVSAGLNYFGNGNDAASAFAGTI